MTPRRKKWIIWGSSVIGVLLLVVLIPICIGVFNLFHAHEHCIKQVGTALRIYSGEHNGKLPYDTNGFGNALLLLIKDGSLGDTNGSVSVAFITGPGDDGQVFRDAIKTGAPIPDEKCSRIYVQGLSESNNPEIAILFDKKATPGGDQFRRPWGPLLREVCLLDSSMQVISETNWPAFSSNQVGLLVKDGFSRASAQHYYQIR